MIYQKVLSVDKQENYDIMFHKEHFLGIFYSKDVKK